MALKITGRTSWFGGPNDKQNIGTALGLPDTVRGLAVYNRSTLGGYWRVRWPNGKTTVERQVDIGPAPWTKRKIDFTSAAIRAAGYSEKNFPTDSQATIEYLGKNKPTQVAPQAAPRTQSVVPMSSIFTKSLVGSPFSKSLTGSLPKVQVSTQEASTQPKAAPRSTPTGSFNYQAGTPRLTHPSIQRIIREIAGIYGKPLTVGTTTNHSRLSSSGNVSDHYVGNGADIPASGQALTRMGQAALIAAGMNPAQAKKQTGGLFNLTKGGKRYQVIFNTNTGGNHYNHLHIGVK